MTPWCRSPPIPSLLCLSLAHRFGVNKKESLGRDFVCDTMQLGRHWKPAMSVLWDAPILHLLGPPIHALTITQKVWCRCFCIWNLLTSEHNVWNSPRISFQYYIFSKAARQVGKPVYNALYSCHAARGKKSTVCFNWNTLLTISSIPRWQANSKWLSSIPPLVLA